MRDEYKRSRNVWSINRCKGPDDQFTFTKTETGYVIAKTK